MSRRYRHSAPPQHAVASTRPHGRLARGLHRIDGIPVLVVSRSELAGLKEQTGALLLSDLDGAAPLDHHDPEETDQ